MKFNQWTLVLAAALVFTLGCKTTSNPTGVVVVGTVSIDPYQTGKAVQIAAKLGGMAAIKQNPETKQYFQAASIAIGAVIAKGNTTPEAVGAALQGITSDVLVTTAIADALSLYADYYGKLVTSKLDSASPYTVPVLSGLAAGLQQAVTLSP
jgi:hypothetical protein